MTDIDGAWQTIRARAELHDVRIHDTRHSFAVQALTLFISRLVALLCLAPRSVRSVQLRARR